MRVRKDIAVALCALCVSLGGWVQASVAQPVPKDPFVFKSAKNVRVVRAVASGKLYVFYFAHHDGVWWLLGAQLASSLPSGPKT